MKKNKFSKIILVSFLIIVILGGLPYTISFTNQLITGGLQTNRNSDKKINIAYVGSSHSIVILKSFLKENYGEEIKLVKVKDGENIDNTIKILIALQSDFAIIRSSQYFDEINQRIESGELGILLLEENALTVVTTQKKAIDMSINIETGETTSNLNNIETITTIFQYHMYTKYQRNNGVQVQKRYEGVTYTSYLNHIKQYLEKMIESIESSDKPEIKTSSNGDWIKKKEIVGQHDFDYFEVYTRFEIYKLAYTDTATNPWSDYYWVDSYVHHKVNYFIWTPANVGFWTGKRTIFADADYDQQNLYIYKPTGTVGSDTVSYSVTFIVNTQGQGSLLVGYSHSWNQPEVVITDQSSMIDDYAKWIESFSGPDYLWWPVMDWCKKPCLVSRSSFYSQPSLVVQVPTGDGLCLPKLQSEYQFYYDTNFQIILLVFLKFTRYIYTYSSYTTWNYITVDKGSGGGGGCPILSVYDGKQLIEEGLLDIHAYDDITSKHILTTKPQTVEGKYLLRLTEHPKTISHIDQVQLLATLKDGKKILLPLHSATHSTNEDVTSEILLSDDIRVDNLGADHNNGESEYIDLAFQVPEGLKIQDLTFLIEGFNMFVK